MSTPALQTRPTGAQLRARRNPRLIAIGLLAACLGGLGAAALFQQSSQTVSVLVAARTVHRGEVIQQSDLRTVEVRPENGLRTLGANAAGEVTGQVALVDMAEGSLITPGSYGTVNVAAGTVQLGLRLSPGRLPVRELPAGSRLLLIGVSSNAADNAGRPLGNAEVVTAPQVSADGVTVVLDIAVAQDLAPTVAQMAASDRLVLVRES